MSMPKRKIQEGMRWDANLTPSVGDATRTMAMMGAASRLLKITKKTREATRSEGGEQRAGGSARTGEGAWWRSNRNRSAIAASQSLCESTQSMCC
jgi:hypothetical protein